MDTYLLQMNYFRPSNGHPLPFRPPRRKKLCLLFFRVSIPNGRVGSNIRSSKRLVLFSLDKEDFLQTE